MNLYQLGPFTPIYNINRETQTIAMMERRNEYKLFGDEVVPYSEDPIYVEPELYCVRDEVGGERLLENVKDKRNDELIVSVLFTCGMSGDILCVPYAQIMKL